MNQRFRDMVRRVGRGFYERHIAEVRSAVKSRTLNKLIQTLSAANTIGTVDYRVSAMASAVRNGYDFEISAKDAVAGGVGRRPRKFWIEVYWPVEPGERDGTDKTLYLYFHKQKFKANKKISKGDMVLFYETKCHPDQSWLGAQTIFASGVVSDDTGEPISPNSYSGKKWWVWKRPIQIEANLPPAKGVPLNDVRRILGWGRRAKLRRGPMSISEGQFNELVSQLRASRVSSKALQDKKRGGHPRQLDVEKRLRIERRAVDLAVKYYEGRGYEVRSVEKENVGWDLEAQASGHTVLIEVKGLSGSSVSIGLTPNEYRVMKQPSKRAQYRIFIVANALGKTPGRYEFFYSDNPPRWENVDGKSLKIKEILSANLSLE